MYCTAADALAYTLSSIDVRKHVCLVQTPTYLFFSENENCDHKMIASPCYCPLDSISDRGGEEWAPPRPEGPRVGVIGSVSPSVWGGPPTQANSLQTHSQPPEELRDRNVNHTDKTLEGWFDNPPLLHY